MFICDKCGEKELTWKKFYNEYLQLYKVKEKWDNEKDKVSCIIGFFCHMYKERYNTNYVFIPSNFNPYSSKECRDTWALLAAFNGNAHDVRKYIYWLFKKGTNKSTTITSFGYVNTPTLIRKYNLQVASKHILHRESKLPTELINWCKNNIPKILENYSLDTMNDLGALLNYCKTYPPSNGSNELLVLTEAEKMGLIKEGKLNIG